MDIAKIKPYDKNAKKHPKKQVEQVAASIKEFGFNQPIVVDKNGVIVVGHGRYEAAKLLGLTDVPILEVNLTEEQANAYRLADNKLNESEWDMKLVIEELKGLSEPMLDLTGFNKDLLEKPEAKDDELPDEMGIEPVSNLGAIFQLGRHRLMCGDSTQIEDLEKLMNGQKADMVFTDPPYNVNYKGSANSTKDGLKNDNMDAARFQVFLDQCCVAMAKVVKKGAAFYVWHASSAASQFELALDRAGIKVKTQIIWNKASAVLGWGDYQWKHEPCFYAGFKDQSVNFYGDRTNKTVWTIPETEEEIIKVWKRIKESEANGKTTVWTVKRDNTNEYRHPTQKPVELATKAIINSSKTDDIVLDMFLGSGSTLIACEKLGRSCYGLELDEKHVDLIIKRWEDYTGEKAIKLTK